MKKILAVLLMISMLCVPFAVSASAEGETYEYKVDFNNLNAKWDLFSFYQSTWKPEFTSLKELLFIPAGMGAVTQAVGSGVGRAGAVYFHTSENKNLIECPGGGNVSIICFKAPVAGEYTTKIAADVYHGSNLGNIFYFIGNATKGYTENKQGTEQGGRHDFADTSWDGVYTLTFNLEKDDEIMMCFLAWDHAVYKVNGISVTLKNAAEVPPEIVDPNATTEAPVTNPPETTSDANDKKDDKKDIDPIVIVAAVAAVVVIAGVVVSVVVIKKKK